MIDIENDVYSQVASAVRNAHPGTSVSGEYIEVPSSFPAVTLAESDNRIFTQMRTTKIENAVRVMYEARVWSNKAKGKKAEAKAIMDTVDSTMGSLGFTRTFRSQIPNLQQATIFQLISRYEAVVGPHGDNGYLIYQS